MSFSFSPTESGASTVLSPTPCPRRHCKDPWLHTQMLALPCYAVHRAPCRHATLSPSPEEILQVAWCPTVTEEEEHLWLVFPPLETGSVLLALKSSLLSGLWVRHGHSARLTKRHLNGHSFWVGKGTLAHKDLSVIKSSCDWIPSSPSGLSITWEFCEDSIAEILSVALAATAWAW